jgi:hypothetical protein
MGVVTNLIFTCRAEWSTLITIALQLLHQLGKNAEKQLEIQPKIRMLFVATLIDACVF